MAIEKRETELKRLRAEQYKTRQDEVFGGLSPAELAEYNRKSDQIDGLESEIQASAVAEKSSQSAKAEQYLSSGTKNPKQIPPKLRLISPTAVEKKIRQALPVVGCSESFSLAEVSWMLERAGATLRSKV
jgi:hypothetical protein